MKKHCLRAARHPEPVSFEAILGPTPAVRHPRWPDAQKRIDALQRQF
jgi:hypothetical protein